MKRRLLLSIVLLLLAIFLMFVALRYFFEIYLPKGDCAGSVVFYTWLGLAAFGGAVRLK